MNRPPSNGCGSAARRVGGVGVLAVTLLAGAPALAGPPMGWQPGVEGQQGAGPVAWAADGRSVAVTAWSRATLSALRLDDAVVRSLSAERGAGFHPVWVADGWLFKEVASGDRGEREQRIVWADAATGERQILERGPQLGDPSATFDGLVAWMRGSTLTVRQAIARSDWPLVSRWRVPSYGNLVALAPAGERVVLQGPGGSMFLLELADGRTHELAVERGSYRPEWSPDGTRLCVRGSGDWFSVLDAASGRIIATADGTNPTWIPGRQALLFDRVETLPYEVLESELWLLDLERGQAEALTDSPLHERYPVAAPDGRSVAFVDTRSGDLLLASLGLDDRLDAPVRLVAAGDLPSAPSGSGGGATRAVEVFVPYMHQLWDTPDDFDGGWSCGPTSCVQTVQKYAILPNHDITVSSPTPHTSPWGFYVPSEYSFNGYTYDTLGLAKGDVWVPGAHGFICRDIGAAYWAYMVDYCNQHGLESWQAGASFDTLPTEIDAGYPMYASTNVLGYGHIIVMKGYDPNHSVVTNDPYGDANGSWGQFNGNGAVYDWPGYNNGNLEIGVSQLFGARGTLVEPEPEWDAAFVASEYPATMVAGQVGDAWVEYTNEGTQSWDPGATMLGTTEARDRESAFYDAATWTTASRPSAVDAATAPAATGRFSFQLRAPDVSVETSFTECWGLVQEGVTWFGPADNAVCFEIVVVPPGAADVPEADAGPDRTVALGGTVTLDGSGSSDSDGTIVSWVWQTPQGELEGESAELTPSEVGVFSITLTVTDDVGLSDSDSATITVTDGAAAGPGGLTGGNESDCDCWMGRPARARGAWWLGVALALATGVRRRRLGVSNI